MKRRPDRTGTTVHTPQDNRTEGDLPWLDYELKKLIRRRDRIHKKWKKTGGDELYAAFRALKRLRQTKETVLGACGHPDFRRNSRSEST